MDAAARVAGLDAVPEVAMHGKTDPQILHELFTAAELAQDVIDGLIPDAITAAEAALVAAEAELKARGGLLPGVVDVLERLDATPGVRQTLVTGNLTGNAAVKLAAFGLSAYFDHEVGAYGTDHADRLELVPIALERVERFRGERYEPDEVWVVGDTHNDLACARAGGVRCLLVGTGPLGPEDLAAAGADAALADLSDIDRVHGILVSDVDVDVRA